MTEWLSLTSVATHIDVSYDHAKKRVVTHPTFPQPARPNGGHPRWRRSEVDAWMQSQKQ